MKIHLPKMNKGPYKRLVKKKKVKKQVDKKYFDYNSKKDNYLF